METEVLPSGASTVIDFEKAIADSKQTLAEAQAPKRGRGRPPGTTKKKPIEPGDSPQDQIAAEPGSPGENQTVTPEIINMSEVEPFAGEVVRLPFDIAGLKTGIDLSLDDKEAKIPTFYLTRLIQSYLPDLDIKEPKKFNLIAFLILFALLSVRKMRKFSLIRRAQIIQAQANSRTQPAEGESGTQPSPGHVPLPSDSHSAASFFNGRT